MLIITYKDFDNKVIITREFDTPKDFLCLMDSKENEICFDAPDWVAPLIMVTLDGVELYDLKDINDLYDLFAPTEYNIEIGIYQENSSGIRIDKYNIHKDELEEELKESLMEYIDVLISEIKDGKSITITFE